MTAGVSQDCFFWVAPFRVASFTEMSQSGQNRPFAVAGECTCMCSMVGPPFVDEMIQ